MKIVSDREFRNRPGKFRRELAGQDIVMTSRGKPYAVMLPIDQDTDVGTVLELAARIRAQMALSSVRQKAAEKGMETLPEEAIDSEIRAVREKKER